MVMCGGIKVNWGRQRETQPATTTLINYFPSECRTLVDGLLGEGGVGVVSKL